jgi:hypothetical protein
MLQQLAHGPFALASVSGRAPDCFIPLDTASLGAYLRLATHSWDSFNCQWIRKRLFLQAPYACSYLKFNVNLDK